MEIPKPLLDQILDGQVVLFLGAGASIGAIHSKGEHVPSGADLAKKIVEKFLTPDYQNESLDIVSELAISQTDLFTFQSFIAEIFTQFSPSGFHELIPTFKWKVKLLEKNLIMVL